MSKRFLICCAGLSLAMTGAAMAGHGKPGLWTVTTTMQMARVPNMSPAAAEDLRRRGLTNPMNGQPFTNQICMTEDDIENDRPPRMVTRPSDCTTRILRQTPASVTTESICHGQFEGVGRAQIAWQGTDHYSGTYNFSGRIRGDSNRVSTSFKGDWVRFECGGVKPYIPPVEP